MDRHSSISMIALLLLIFSRGILGATFTIINKCGYTIWPGILSNAGSNPLPTTGFELPPATSQTLQSLPNWSGRFWARTGCRTDPATAQFLCATGDCGSGRPECNGRGATPPATLAEFTVAAGGQDFYDVSLVDGFNLPAAVEPTRAGAGACLSAGCAADLNRRCPAELRAGEGQACRSACEAFGKAEYCCSGEFGSPDTCRPSVYSEIFKSACPKSYSYAYDDPTSTFTCTGADYVITFCPASTSQKSATSTTPPSTNTSTTSSSNGAITTDSSTTGAEMGFPIVENGPWLPNFAIGDSSKIFPFTTFQATFTLFLTLLISMS